VTAPVAPAPAPSPPSRPTSQLSRPAGRRPERLALAAVVGLVVGLLSWLAGVREPLLVVAATYLGFVAAVLLLSHQRFEELLRWRAGDGAAPARPAEPADLRFERSPRKEPAPLTLAPPRHVPGIEVPYGLEPEPDPAPVVPSVPANWIDESTDPALDVPFRQRALSNDDFVDAGVAFAVALATVLLLRAVLAWTDLIGPCVLGYFLFLAVLYVVSRDRIGRETGFDRMVTFLIWSAGAAVIAVLAWMVIFLLVKGLPDLKPGFFVNDLAKTGPADKGGGAKHAIIGTAQQVGIATAVVVPLAILTAVYLHEMKGRLAGPVRFFVDAMSGLPSIVAGLLVFTVWVHGHGFSGAAGSAALVVLMLPTVTRASEEILRTVPDSLREASLALGAPQWRVVLRVVLPTASAGIVTAVILGIARAAGETAPMLLTAFGTTQTNTDPTKGPQSDLPTFVFELVRQPNTAQVNRAWTGLLVLVLLVLILFTTARYVSGRAQRKLRRAR
jgi:phosphate transport system permease protein